MPHNQVRHKLHLKLQLNLHYGLNKRYMQKIKEIDLTGNEGTDDHKKEAIMGALTLYLDFINLFIKLLRIFGKRK